MANSKDKNSRFVKNLTHMGRRTYKLDEFLSSAEHTEGLLALPSHDVRENNSSVIIRLVFSSSFCCIFVVQFMG